MMRSYEKYFLILFICYLPLYLALLLYLRTKIRGYTVRQHMVSVLATSEEPWRSMFNVSTILYGALSFVLPFSLYSIHRSDLVVTRGVATLLGAGIATILIGFFPMDRQFKVHNIIGFLAFLSVLFTGGVFFTIFSQGMLFSPLMELINFAVFVTTFLLGISLLFRPEHSSLLEWVAFLCALAWNFLLASLLLIKLF